MEKSELFEDAIVHLKKGVKTIWPPDMSQHWRDAENNPERNPYKNGVYVRVSETYLTPGKIWCHPIVKKGQYMPFLARLEDLEPALIQKGLMKNIGFMPCRYSGTGKIVKDSFYYPTRKVNFTVDFEKRKVRRIRIYWTTKEDIYDEDDWTGTDRYEDAHVKYAHELQKLLDYMPNDENLMVANRGAQMARVHYFGRNANKNIDIQSRYDSKK